MFLFELALLSLLKIFKKFTFGINDLHFDTEYSHKQFQISFLRTKDGAEIDLIIERPARSTLLLEIKSSHTLRAEDFRNLNQFAKDIPDSKAFCLYGGDQNLGFGDVQCLNWRVGIQRILGES